jgi:hypothetical protein
MTKRLELEISSSINCMPMTLVRLICSYHKYRCCELTDAASRGDISVAEEVLSVVEDVKKESENCPLHRILPVTKGNQNRRDARLLQLIPKNNAPVLLPLFREKEFDFISHAAFLCGLNNKIDVLLMMGNYVGRRKLQVALFGCAIGGHMYFNMEENKCINMESKNLKIKEHHYVYDPIRDKYTFTLMIPKLLCDKYYNIRRYRNIRNAIFSSMQDTILFLAIMNNSNGFADIWKRYATKYMKFSRPYINICAHVAKNNYEDTLSCIKAEYSLGVGPFIKSIIIEYAGIFKVVNIEKLLEFCDQLSQYPNPGEGII